MQSGMIPCQNVRNLELVGTINSLDVNWRAQKESESIQFHDFFWNVIRVGGGGGGVFLDFWNENVENSTNSNASQHLSP